MSAFAGALFIFTIGIPRAHAALGISPPFINADHLTAGALYRQTIYLVQDQPNQNLPMTATLRVPDAIKSWFSIDQGFNFVIPKGTRQFPVTVTITVPQHQPLGVYSGKLTFTSNPAAAGQVTIALGVNVALNLTVGTGIYESYQAYLTIVDIEEGWNPRVDIKFRNDGNIPESFDSATFELFDQFDTVRLAYLQKNSDFPETPPFTTNEYVVEFPTDFHIGLGQYWGSTVFIKNGKIVGSQKTVFNVVPAGSLSSPSALFIQRLQKNWKYYAAGFALVVVGGYLLYRKKWLRAPRRK